MVKPHPFDIPLSFLVGMLIPLACPRAVGSAKSMALNRCFAGLLLWELFFLVPLGAYLYFFYPDWSLMFFVDPGTLDQETRIIIGLIAIFCYLAAGVGGFFLAAWLVRQRRASTARIVFMAVIAALLIFAALTMGRLTQVGSYYDWIATPPATLPIYAHRIGYVTGVDGIAAAVFLVLMLRDFRQKTQENPLLKGART